MDESEMVLNTVMEFLIHILQDGFFAAVAAVGFGCISSLPRKAYGYCALTAAVGHALRYVLMDPAYVGMSIVGAALIASLTVGAGAVCVARRAGCPAEAISFPALLPMIPGMYAYRTLEALFQALSGTDEGHFMHSLYLFSSNGLTCLFVILGMVVGVTVPIFLFKGISFHATR